MKKTIITVVMSLMACLGMTASSGKGGENITWTLDNYGVLTFSGSGPMKNFGDTPYRPQLVESVVIEDGITTIGANAFKGCNKLSNIDIPMSVKEIGANAFNGCKILPEINIPYGVTNIGVGAFAGCTMLTEMELPGSLRTIGAKAFDGCKNLVKIRVPASVTSIGRNAFKDCKFLEKINELPDFITANNAIHYGLNRDAVERYLRSVEVEMAAVAVPVAVPAAQVAPQVTPVAMEAAVPVSDVDVAIPRTKAKNEKTFAVIISNENYSKMVNVPYALNDGNVFHTYCEKTLGIPERNIIHYSDATSGSMREVLSELKMASRIVGGDMKLIFYYSGHGAPDAATQEGYLIPVDASRVNPDVCLSLTELYESLSKLDIEMATIFLDACFSGGERNGNTLMAANGERLVKIKQKENAPKGRMVVFSATDGDQTALPYAEKGHGIFTYYLLKKLKDSAGSAPLAEIADYVKKEVSNTAFSQNRQEQTPTVATSEQVNGVWQNVRLNN